MSRFIAFSGLLLVLVAGCKTTVETVVRTSSDSIPPTVVFATELPATPPEMSFYKLTPRADAKERVMALARAMSANIEPSGLISDCPPGRCRRDEASGSVEVFADFGVIAKFRRDRLKSKFDPAAAQANARLVLADTGRSLSSDGVSEIFIDAARVIKHVRYDGDSKPPDSRLVADIRPGDAMLVYVPARRLIQGRPVDGPGSRMFIATGDGSGAMLFNWKDAAPGGTVRSTRTPAEVKAEIERQLLSIQPRNSIYVNRIDLAFYDAGADLLQPVYRYVAEIGRTSASVGRAERVLGYLPFGETNVTVPSVDRDLAYDSPTPAPAGVTAAPAAANAAGNTAPSVQLGRYVVRQDHKGWISNADQFWTIAGTRGALQFVNKQYYFAAPEQFTSKKNQFVNSVDLALIEAHGFPWGFATNGDHRELVDFSDADSIDDGYGALADGTLKHLVLHSCSAVPAPPDEAYWAKPWLNVFNGLHSVVGYRSSMFIDDGANDAFARGLQAGVAVVPAWFNAVASLNAYGIDGYGSSHCGGFEPMGRAAAVVACDSFSAGPAEATPGRKNCLDVLWMDDDVRGGYQP